MVIRFRKWIKIILHKQPRILPKVHGFRYMLFLAYRLLSKGIIRREPVGKCKFGFGESGRCLSSDLFLFVPTTFAFIFLALQMEYD